MIAQTDLDNICTALETTGYIILPTLFSDSLIDALYKHVRQISPQFKAAGIGRQQQHQINQTIRSDHTQWLEGNAPAEQAYLDDMKQLQKALNRHLFLGLSSYESHFAHYPTGAFYQRHRDAFSGKSNRIVTTLLYLNPDWKGENGGELLIYPDIGGNIPLEQVLPHYGKVVIFMSDQFPHEVLPANRDRYSIAGWFRTD